MRDLSSWQFRYFPDQFQLSIIGATENRRDRLCGDFSSLSVTSLILAEVDAIPFSVDFYPILRLWYYIVVLFRFQSCRTDGSIDRLSDRTDSLNQPRAARQNQDRYDVGDLSAGCRRHRPTALHVHRWCAGDLSAAFTQAREDKVAKGQLRSNREKKKPKAEKSKKKGAPVPSPLERVRMIGKDVSDKKFS
jgi:hypothetical protein